MAEFLIVLGRVNLAICVAILLVYLMRGPVRDAFHAQIAYGLWLLVPVAALASLLPPRAVVIRSPSAMGVIGELSSPITAVTMHPMVSAPRVLLPDLTLLLFAAWLIGACGMVLYLVRLQQKFHLAERAGVAGPAVAGFFRPRIVVPSTFEEQFSVQEQTAILAHERAHLARQDARINALAALLRCLCWFNPLVHIASVWLRRDQELACDAAALRYVPAVQYANALLKAQMPPTSLPLGCTWPGSEHPLTERVALLIRPMPKAGRRQAGIFSLAIVMASGGMGAWAAQPPTERIAQVQVAQTAMTDPVSPPVADAAPIIAPQAPAERQRVTQAKETAARMKAEMGRIRPQIAAQMAEVRVTVDRMQLAEATPPARAEAESSATQSAESSTSTNGATVTIRRGAPQNTESNSNTNNGLTIVPPPGESQSATGSRDNLTIVRPQATDRGPMVIQFSASNRPDYKNHSFNSGTVHIDAEIDAAIASAADDPETEKAIEKAMRDALAEASHKIDAAIAEARAKAGLPPAPPAPPAPPQN